MSTTENTTNPATPEQVAEQAAESQKVELMVAARPQLPDGKLYGFADVHFGGEGENGYTIPGFQIKMNREGTLYTDMPGGYDKAGNWKEAVRPHSPAAYKHLNEAVLTAYTQEIENTRAMLLAADAQREAVAQAIEQGQQAPAATQPGKVAEPAKAAEPAKDTKAADKKPSLSGALKEKQAQVKAAPPAEKAAGARGTAELGA